MYVDKHNKKKKLKVKKKALKKERKILRRRMEKLNKKIYILYIYIIKFFHLVTISSNYIHIYLEYNSTSK